MGAAEHASRIELLGRCAAMEELRGQIAAYGASDLRVHVFGETGTGKERVARALHAASSRRHGPFVPFNAAGFTDDLVEAELFGHGRGAFTGAVGEREGFVRKAEGGTLFLDEVAELTPRAQAKLLRYLQEREFCRLGETVSRPSDVRVISATNVDLARRVEQGRFRADLWFRFQEARVVVPPLRERGGDVLLLARHFLRREAGRCGRACPSLSPAAEAVLGRYAWPGNVRQLESVMRRAFVVVDGPVVEVRHLSPEVRESGGWRRGCLRVALEDFERAYVTRVLAHHRGVRTAAAAELGITRQALVNKIRRLGVTETESAP
jgi:two-component system response regulator HydG